MKIALMVVAMVAIVAIAGSMIYYFVFFRPGIEKAELILLEQNLETVPQETAPETTAPPETTAEGEALSNAQPVIDSATDSLGNIQTFSTAKENGSNSWPYPTPIIYIGDVITFTINAIPTSGVLYNFIYFPPGGNMITIQSWSDSNTCTWTIPKEAFGKGGGLSLEIKNDDGLNFIGNCDDNSFLQYTVLSR